ncbi:MAG: DUF2892 domain-containing protein [Gemmatimonas sp.]|jgi:uncharacterized membrane protein|uniref:SRPBCC family protein n=1 Tax=Gemmatimonas sp. TaxID=1962908 RepID=UPI0031C2382B|nr:DUF2892 domain-containing protein [Gemmatimonas sp.]
MASATTAFSNVMARNRADERELRRAMTHQGMGERRNVGGGERVLSAVAGGLLALWGLKRRGSLGYGAAALGAELVYRGASGHCKAYSALGITTKETGREGQLADVDHDHSVDVRHSVFISRPRHELYAIWRDFSKLPQFMTHLERVDVLSPTKSHWVTKGPAGISVEWDAEIVDEREGEWIAWRSIEPTEVPNNGTVMFREAPGGGTEVFVTLEAQPPAGTFDDMVTRMFGRSPARQVRRGLERFKRMVESGHGFPSSPSMSASDREVGLSNAGLSDLAPREITTSARRGPSISRKGDEPPASPTE